jgi:PAS domain-containing protein
MKTLAELKREAKTGQYQAKMIYRYGEDIPEKLSGWRQIIDSNSVAIFLLNNEGKKSELNIKAASLIDYDGEHLTIYNAGERELNEEEKAIMEEWNKIAATPEYQTQAQNDAYTDGSTTFYQKKYFFTGRGFTYLLGYDEQGGKKYNHNTKKVRCNNIKGDKIMQYEIAKR